MDQFFHEGGTARDLLQPLNQADKVKSSDAALAFNAYESILLYLGASTTTCAKSDEGEERTTKLTKMQRLAIDLTREVLANHLK